MPFDPSRHILPPVPPMPNQEKSIPTWLPALTVLLIENWSTCLDMEFIEGINDLGVSIAEIKKWALIASKEQELAKLQKEIEVLKTGINVDDYK